MARIAEHTPLSTEASFRGKVTAAYGLIPQIIKFLTGKMFHHAPLSRPQSRAPRMGSNEMTQLGHLSEAKVPPFVR